MIEPGGWDGDFRHLGVRLWPEVESDVAAVIVTRGGEARLWVNRAVVMPHYQRWVEMWGWFAARHRPPLGVLYQEDLACLASDLNPYTA